MQLYPGWSARDNYASHTKKKRKKKDGTPNKGSVTGRTDHFCQYIPGYTCRLLPLMKVHYAHSSDIHIRHACKLNTVSFGQHLMGTKFKAAMTFFQYLLCMHACTQCSNL